MEKKEGLVEEKKKQKEIMPNHLIIIIFPRRGNKVLFS